MKHAIALLLVLLIAAVPQAAAADGMGSHPRSRTFIPVLVNVDAQGHVRDVSPAYPLRWSMRQQVRQALDEMISKPAMLNGKAVSSQFIATLKLQLIQQTDGSYTLRFSLVSSRLVPHGSWFWLHRSNGTLALAAQDGRRERPYFGRPYPPFWNHNDSGNPAGGGTQPTAASAASMSPGSSPSRGMARNPRK